MTRNKLRVTDILLHDKNADKNTLTRLNNVKKFLFRSSQDLISLISFGNDFQRVAPSYMKPFFMLLVRVWDTQSEFEIFLSLESVNSFLYLNRLKIDLKEGDKRLCTFSAYKHWWQCQK